MIREIQVHLFGTGRLAELICRSCLQFKQSVSIYLVGLGTRRHGESVVRLRWELGRALGLCADAKRPRVSGGRQLRGRCSVRTQGYFYPYLTQVVLNLLLATYR